MDVKNSLVAIEELVNDYKCVQDKLLDIEPSSAQNVLRYLTKMFVLSCASYYENTIIDALKVYAKKHSAKYKLLPHGFDTIEKYSFFKMFDFGRNNDLNKVKAFLSPLAYFGIGFKDTLITEVSGSETKEREMQAFQEICSIRNSLAHNDLITYDGIGNKSFEDIKCLHIEAIKFVELLKQKFT